jgi:hypothetical protein
VSDIWFGLYDVEARRTLERRLGPLTASDLWALQQLRAQLVDAADGEEAFGPAGQVPDAEAARGLPSFDPEDWLLGPNLEMEHDPDWIAIDVDEAGACRAYCRPPAVARYLQLMQRLDPCVPAEHQTAWSRARQVFIEARDAGHALYGCWDPG